MTGKWTANLYPLSEIIEPIGGTGGRFLYLMSPHGSEVLDRLKVVRRGASQTKQVRPLRRRESDGVRLLLPGERAVRHVNCI